MRRSTSPLDGKTNKSGSPQPGEPLYLSIGKFRRAHGVKGEMVMEVNTDFPEHIKPGMTIYVGKEKKQHQVTSIRPMNQQLLVSLAGFEDCDVTAIFRNQLVYILSSSVPPLPEGIFYHHEIIGMQVVDENGESLGTVTEILVTGANDVYVVKKDSGEELLLPAIKSVLLEINRETKTITARPQDWV